MDSVYTGKEAEYPLEGLQAIGPLQRVTLKQRLERDRKRYEERLDSVNKALSMMEENPKLVEILDAIQNAQ